MAFAITKENQVGINSYKYNLTSPLLETYLSPLPGKVDIGGSEYSKENYLSQWIQKDRRGGILINEMDETIHSNRCWWTNCIISHDGHLTLPRKATSVALPSGTAAGYANPTGFTDAGATWTSETSAYDDNAATYASGTIASGPAWTDVLKFSISSEFYCNKVRFDAWYDATYMTQIKIEIEKDGAWVSVFQGAFTDHTSTEKTFTGAIITAARVSFYSPDAGANTAKLYEFDFYRETTPIGSLSSFANFNGEKYAAFGKVLAKLASGRASYTYIKMFNQDITTLIPSLNSRLYVFLGNSTNYYYMSTAEAFTQSNSSAAYYAIENAGLLYKMNSTGTFASSADPDGATPTWNNLADITTDTSKIEGLFRGRDSDGNYVVYCAMNTALMVYDATNNKWLPTELRLPDHPNGGKGATYWNDGHYLSYGLGVKKYTVGSTASISEVGLERDGGLPIEYNGEIVKFSNDSQYFLAALVDSSQTSGNSKSGLYVWTGMSWECWWADANNNAAMHDVIVSSAESGYAIYWDCGGVVYYIDIPRGIQNPKQLAGTQTYEAAGILISPWFDAGTAAFPNLITAITSYARSVTTTETITIQYRLNHLYEDRDTGWTTLVTLDTTAENGAVETLLASGAGLSSDAIQFRIDLARGSTTTLSPDLLALVTSYMLKKTDANNKAWAINIILDGEADNTSANQQYDNIWSALGAGTLVPFIFRRNATNETHYVQLFLTGSSIPTGDHWGGEMSLQAVEI